MALRAGGLTGLMNQPSAQVIDGSLKFDSSKSIALTRTPGSAGNRRTFTFSAWVKRHKLGTDQKIFGVNSNWFTFYFTSSDNLIVYYENSGSQYFTTNAVFRDVSAWYHIVLKVDTTQSTASDRVKIYVNSEELTFSATGTTSQNYEFGVNTTNVHDIGMRSSESNMKADFSLAGVHFIDGLALGPGYFGFTDPLTGTWRPKKFRAEGTTVNDGTQWSSLVDVSNATVNNGSAANLFDGDTTTKINISAGYIEIDLSSRDVQAGPEGIEVYNNEAGVYTSYQVNGEEVINWQGSAGWMSMGGVDSKINTIRINYITGGGVNAAFAFRVNGVVMQDSTTQNLAFGTNGFYLPFDGNSLIGQDKSGQGNNWTPVNFGGSNSVDKATGALPILEGAGGAVANVGVRTDAYASNLVLALPLVGGANDVSNRINSGSTAKTVSVSGDPASSTIESNFYGASFYFDGSANTDYVSVADNDQLDVGSGDFTIECWAYVSGYPNTNPGLLSKRGGNGAAHWQLALNRNGQIQFGDQATWSNYFGTSSGTTGDQIFKDNWHHIAITRTSGSIQAWYDGREYGTAITNTTNFSTSANFSVGVGREDNYDPFQGYVSDVRVYKGISKYTSNFVVPSTNPDILPDTPSGVSGGSKLTKITDGAVSFDKTGDCLTVADNADFEFGSGDFTLEAFIYYTGNPGTSNDTYVIFSKWDNQSAPNDKGFILRISDDSSGDNLQWFYTTDGSTNQSTTGSTLLNPNNWYHIAFVRNGSTGTFYIDGVADSTTVSFGSDSIRDTGNAFRIGANLDGGSVDQEFSGFISNARVVKGTAVYTGNRFTPPAAPLTNVTNTKLLCCQSNTSATAAAVTPGTITAVGDAAATTFNPFNTDINTVRGQETGYATLNPLVSTVSLSDGNLHQSQTSGTWNVAVSSIPMSTGKWYCEVTIETSNEFQIGIVKLDDGPNWVANFPIVDFEYGWGMIADASNGTGRLRSDYITPVNGQTNQAYGPFSPTAGDTISMAYDADNQTLTYFVNGINFGDTTSIWAYPPTAGEYVFANSVTTNTDVLWNFGQKPFKFPPPEGYQPLNTANVRPETVIARPDQFVGITTWRGNDTQRDIRTLNMKPDLVWIKQRTGSANHSLMDTVRGATKNIVPNDTQSEGTETGYLNAFIDNGFSLGTSSIVNDASNDYVAWAWKAGGSKNTFNVDDVGYASASAAGLTGGDITPTGASAGTKQGFSIITYAGTNDASATIPTGLNEETDFAIVKATNQSYSWYVYHISLASSNRLILNITDAQATDNNGFIYRDGPGLLGLNRGSSSGNNVNASTVNYVAYCWHDVPGLQKFGQFAGNNSADGVFVELGFKPAILLIKNYNSTGDWIIWDNERNPHNPVNRQIWPYTTSGTYGAYDQVASNYPLDFLSNGFKMRTTDADMNGSSRTYIYCAWAEAPTVNLYGGSSNAR